MADPPLPPAAGAPPTHAMQAANNGPTPMDQGPTTAVAQNSTQAANSNAQIATPMRMIIANDGGSAVSALTNNTNSTTTHATSASNNNNSNKRTTPSSPDELDVPSPKRTVPDFSKPRSDDVSCASGDESEGWAREEERMLAEAAAKAQAEEEADEAMADEIVQEAQEWENLVSGDDGNNNNNDGALGSADDAVEYEYVEMTNDRNTTNDALKAVCKAIGVGASGKKDDLFLRIWQSKHDNIIKTDGISDKFTFKRVKEKERDDIPKWLILTPQNVEADEFPEINVRTGAEKGFFGPTNKDNVEGAVKHNFLVEQQITRPAFESKKRAKTANPAPTSTSTSTRNNNSTTPPDNGSTNQRGGPSDAARKQIGNIRFARPIDFFNTQISPEFIEKVVVPCTNARAQAEGSGPGGTTYTDYVPFTAQEIYKMIGLLFANGLCPRPQLEMWFLSTQDSRLFGNDYIGSALDKKISYGNGTITIKGM